MRPTTALACACLFALLAPSTSQGQVTPTVFVGVGSANQTRQFRGFGGGWRDSWAEGSYRGVTAGGELSWGLAERLSVRTGLGIARRGFGDDTHWMRATHLAVPMVIDAALVRLWDRTLSISVGRAWSRELGCDGEAHVPVPLEGPTSTGLVTGCDQFRSSRTDRGWVVGGRIGPFEVLGLPLTPDVLVFSGDFERNSTSGYSRHRNHEISVRVSAPLTR
jgi:hypothetical protein